MPLEDPTFQRCPHDKENPYTMISRELIRDKDISPECRWLIIYLLANKDSWKIHMREVVNHCHGQIGRDRVYAIVNEAIDAGYMQREKYIVNGLERVRYFVSESPKFKKCLPRPGIPDAGIPDAGNQDSKGIASSKDNQSKELSCPKPEAGHRTVALEVAEELWKRILAIHPNAKPPKLDRWAKDVEKAMRIDKRSKEDLLEVIRYAFEDDPFWYTVLQSAEKLRKNFDKIWMKKTPISNAGTNALTNAELARKVKQRLVADGDGSQLGIYKNSAVNQNSGDSISYDLPCEVFEEIIFKWFGIRRKNGSGERQAAADETAGTPS